ncbi:interleukin enhancer-binding factor 2-like isoform X2 [Xenia sp. Carnegie-2017]|uniref:interleukin enhancer-binding factor 2-like isoform X2 n=1 Tax=Xenia sp. Carnegie-2017 TaxID=2897299 RepID=UPI001F035366|nr:interleukin enhancer-binding factor 2-like isoform X2 [Xenia sp. Carnegie-2017]
MRSRGGRRGRGGYVQQAFYRPVLGQRFVVTHTPFDLVKASISFQRAAPKADENALTQAILKRNQELTPPSHEQAAVLNLVTKITDIIDTLIVCPNAADLAIEEIRPVGSYKKGTMIAGRPVADLTVILKKLPTTDHIQVVANEIHGKLKEPDLGLEDVSLQVTEGGFTYGHNGIVVRILITTLPRNLHAARGDSQVDLKLLEGGLATIRHSRWFEENAFHTTIRILVRILKDLKNRFNTSGLQNLTPWLIDLLAHRATMANEPVTINVAFRRALQLLASGLFLPGSLGIIDPCESGNVRAQSVLSLDDQDDITTAAQTLLRCLSHGAVNEILGLVPEAIPAVVDSEITSWGGVIVTPGSKAYKKEEEKPDGEENMESDEALGDDTGRSASDRMSLENSQPAEGSLEENMETTT